MAASTSRLAPASDTAARTIIRELPVIQAAPHGPASKPPWLKFWHPANNKVFLSLPALDYCLGPPATFGMHHGTTLTACQIIACNEDGYLSHSHERDHDVIDDDFESVIPPGIYYYHLRSLKSTPYPICYDFSLWKFPHKKLPAAWDSQAAATIPPQNWTTMSLAVKNRDKHCLISLSQDGLTTAHIVPRVQEAWVTRMLIFDVGLSLIWTIILSAP